MRILFLHEVNYQKKPIFEMHEFPEHLSSRGHAVAFVQFPEDETARGLGEIPWKQIIPGRVVPDSEITLYTPKTFLRGLPGRILYSIAFSKNFKHILRDFAPDVIVSFSVPTSGWQALSISKQKGIPFMFRALDVSHRIRKSRLSWLIKSAEKYIYRNCDLLSANNLSMREYCLSLGARESTTTVQYPPLDLHHFKVDQKWRVKMRSKLGILEDADVVLYMGSFFYFSGLPELVRDFSIRSKSDQILVLIGGGEQEAELKALVQELGVEKRVLFTGFVNFEELPKYLAVADVAVNPMAPSLVSNAALPNKVMQYMAAGLPVVTTPLSGLVSIFQNSVGIRFVSAGLDFQNAIQDLLISPEKSRILGALNRELVTDYFSVDDNVSKFEDQLERIVGQNA